MFYVGQGICRWGTNLIQRSHKEVVQSFLNLSVRMPPTLHYTTDYAKREKKKVVVIEMQAKTSLTSSH